MTVTFVRLSLLPRPYAASLLHRLVTLGIMCDSCGAEDEPLLLVRRQYLTPESWDTEASARPADDTEQWCEVCRLHYPHALVD